MITHSPRRAKSFCPVLIDRVVVTAKGTASVRKRATLAGVVAAQLLLLSGGCSGASDDGGRKPPSGASPDDGVSQSPGGADGRLKSLAQTSLGEYLRDEPEVLRSSAPRNVRYPPAAASSLLADPPGRVTAVSLESDSSTGTMSTAPLETSFATSTGLMGGGVR